MSRYEQKSRFSGQHKEDRDSQQSIEGGWRQSIRVALDDIALTNDNLPELRLFRPNESVAVSIRPVPVAANAAGEDALLVEIYEDSAVPRPGRVKKAWELQKYCVMRKQAQAKCKHRQASIKNNQVLYFTQQTDGR